MDITVIIATCGRPAQLDSVLSCLCQGKIRHDHPFEVLIVDNHPEYVARPVVAKWAKSSLKCRHLCSRPNDKAAALNMGIAAAASEWLAFTDDDTLPPPNWLKVGAQYAVESGVRVFGGRITPGDDPPNMPVWLIRGSAGKVPEIGVHVCYDPLPTSGILPVNATAPFGANVFVRRDVFTDLGGYDERLWAQCAAKWPVGCEDSEFGYRLHKSGEPIGYCRDAQMIHPVNVDRASLRLHLHRAYCEGWRQPLIFPDDFKRVFEPFRLRLMGRHFWSAMVCFVKQDMAGAAHYLVEGVRYTGMMAGRWSYAFCDRRHQVAR